MTTVFQDEIFSATDLNRRPGHILDEARLRPVTIMRNDEAFALLLRKDAARMVEASTRAAEMVDLLTAIYRHRTAGERLSSDHAFEWLNAFGGDDLEGLAQELYSVFRKAVQGESSWDEFENTLHEWEESAWAARTPELRAALEQDASQEVPLSAPAMEDAAGPDGQ